MGSVKAVLTVIFAVCLTACNTTSDVSYDSVASNQAYDQEYPSKARFKREQQQRQQRIEERVSGESSTGFFGGLFSKQSEYPSKARFAQMGITKDMMLLKEISERKAGANHHIPELMQVAVTTTEDPRWVSIVGHKRQHASYREPEIKNARLVTLMGPK